ncbi:MAG: hypothetical protein CMJ40_04060 [Phycisphaerae bacterium]|nr:hypothetical protein [Phycisphaerae bacterium]
MTFKWSVLFTVLSAAAMAISASAAVWVVDDDGPIYDFRIIQDAVDAASDGDQIYVMPGVYSESSRPVINFNGKMIEIIGTMEDTILKQQGPHAVVQAIQLEAPGTLLFGFTLTGGQESGLITASDIKVVNCLIENNIGDVAGGVFAWIYGNPQFENCIIQSNHMFDNSPGAGGVYVSGCGVKMVNCTISGNTSVNDAGGFYIYAADVELESCSLDGNIAADKGGAFYIQNDSNVLIRDCEILNNQAGAYGAMLVQGSDVWVVDSKICSNSETQIGGSVDIQGDTCVSDSCGDIDGDGILDECDIDVLEVPTMFPTIQAAIDYASEGDTVLVHPGTYFGSGDAVIDPKGKAILIESSGTAADTIIDGQGFRRGIKMDSNETSDTVISGFTIRSCYASNGAGIYCYYSDPTILDCVIDGNYGFSSGSSYDGGIGVYGWNSEMTLNGCIISNNTFTSGTPGAMGTGAGVKFEGSSSFGSYKPTMTLCLVDGNEASNVNTNVGGVYVYGDCELQMDSCTIQNNSGHGVMAFMGAASMDNCEVIGHEGSGIHLEFIQEDVAKNIDITGCYVASNDEQGINVRRNEVPITLTGCWLESNGANGVLFYKSSGSILATISQNNSRGIYAWSDDDEDSVVINGCTISDNIIPDGQTTTYGAGVYCNQVVSGLSNCYVMNNESNIAAGIRVLGDHDFTLTDCLIQNNVIDAFSYYASIWCQGELFLEGTVFKANQSTAAGTCDLNMGYRENCFIRGENDLGALIRGSQSTMIFESDAYCEVESIVTGMDDGYVNLRFDLDLPTSEVVLEMTGQLDPDGCLSIINSSGSFTDAQPGDLYPLIRADFQGEQFPSSVFPIMPDGLGLRLVDDLSRRSGGVSEVGVEVIEVDTPEFDDPFSSFVDDPPLDIISIDVDGDGDDELAALFDGAPGSIGVYDITEDAAPVLVPGFSVQVGDGPVSLDASDFDGDGDEDLLVANATDSTVTVLLSTPGVGFATTTLSVVGGGSPTCTAIIDWDGSSDLDVVIGIDFGGGSNVFQVIQDVSATPITGPSFVSSGVPTCVSGGPASDAWGFAGGTSTGQVVHANSSSVSLDELLEPGDVPYEISVIKARDLDKAGGDSLIDIALCSKSNETLFLFQGLTSSFGPPIQIDVLVPVEDFVILDADDDDDLDFILASPDSSSEPLLLLRNDEPGIPLRALGGRSWSKQAVTTNSSPRRVASGTLDPKDEEDDWVVGSASLSALRGGEFGEFEQTLLVPVETTCDADLDGNNVVDVDDLLILLNNFGQSGAGDIDGDEVVSIDDLLMLLSSFGDVCR